MFADVMSRWMIPFECAASRALGKTVRCGLAQNAAKAGAKLVGALYEIASGYVRLLS
jgi:hypothetical protein